MYNINDILDMYDTIAYGIDLDIGIISAEDIGIEDLEIEDLEIDMEASEGDTI